MIQKKIPGKDWDYLVYNSLDKIVLTQDGNQRVNNQWLVTKYDVLGRTTITGLWNAGSVITQNTLQTSIYAASQWDAWDYSYNASQNPTGYIISSYPSLTNVLSINYYDDYRAPGLPANYNGAPSTYSSMTKGLSTATKVAVLNTINNSVPDMLWTVNYYDDLGRSSNTYSQHYLGVCSM